MIYLPVSADWLKNLDDVSSLDELEVEESRMAAATDFVTKNVHGVEIFAAGTWTDAFGMTRTWTEGDLDHIVSSFRNGDSEIPLKVGHTTDEFNLKLASDLGVPIELLTGEFGQGAIRLGKVAALTRQGDKVVADLVDVPESLANLIEGGQFNAVSVEMTIEDDGPVATGLALLGAEEPAVDSLAPLDVVDIFQSLSSSHRFIYSNGKCELDVNARIRAFASILANELQKGGSEMDDVTKEGIVDDPVVETEEDSQFAGDDDKDKDDKDDDDNEMSALTKKLGLKSGASMKQIMAAVSKLVDNDDEDDDDEDKRKKMQAEEESVAVDPAITELQAKVAKQDAYIAGLEHDKRVAKYTKIATEWNAIPGKPSEFGTELADIEETVGQVAVDKMVFSYSKANKASEMAGVINTVGHSINVDDDEDIDPFEQEMRDYAKAENIPYEKAMVKFSVGERAKEFDAYHRRSLNAREGN